VFGLFNDTAVMDGHVPPGKRRHERV
jgi:hypothetical protein